MLSFKRNLLMTIVAVVFETYNKNSQREPFDDYLRKNVHFCQSNEFHGNHEVKDIREISQDQIRTHLP